VSRTDRGIIISMREVEIKPDEVGSGAVIGGLGGGLLGSMFGKGDGKILTTAAGAVAGGLAGNAIQNRSQRGREYTVQLQNREIVTLTQGLTPVLSVGQEVYIVNSNRGRSRIVPA
jgi:outer membrane lipoprotein SlyB